MLEVFCFSAFDCGPGLDCVTNKCARREEPPAFAKIECDPGEILEGDKCVAQEGCAQLLCEPGETCLSGVCAATVIDCSEAPCPDGFVCQKKVCVADPCKDKCPPDHACINGECRLLQGLLCVEKCPEPYECVSGTCVKNECRRKVCQLGERCENGLCTKIDGRFCSLAIRDCGEEFACENAACRDKIATLEENGLRDSVAK
ncbi:Protein F46F11.7 [Aphelenchoides avenae]|nr:Protein F46F11.7 [Aphelenchus avenae]